MQSETDKPNSPSKIIYDWHKIEADYITDPSQTYETLSRKHGPSLKTISQHAQIGKWKEKRIAFQEKKRLMVQEKLANRQARESADEIAKMSKAHYDSQQGVKYLADMKVIVDMNKVKNGQASDLSINQIHALANTNKIIQESQRLAKGLNDQELNITLVTQQLAPVVEKIVEVLQAHVPAETLQIITLEFRQLLGEDAA